MAKEEPEIIQLQNEELTFSALTMGQGTPVLCLHGFPDDYRSFRKQMKPIADAGFQVIAPMMRGYEPSSQPQNKDYHVISLAKDVNAWLDHLKIQKAHLIGHDWGAITSYAAAALYPNRFYSLTTIAIPHLKNLPGGLMNFPGQVKNSWYILFFQLPFISDFTVKNNSFAFIEKLWRDWSPGFDLPEEEMSRLKQTFSAPGVLDAALRYYRALPDFVSDQGKESWSALSMPIRLPTLAITGKEDGCMESSLHRSMMKDEDFPAGLQIKEIDHGGHFVHLEKPDEVNKIILDFIEK